MNEITREALKNQVMDVLKDMDDSELVYTWNEYCDRVNMYDDRIESMDMLDELFSGQDVTYILNRAYYGSDQFGDEFCPSREWFMFNGYGNLVSLDWIAYNKYADKFGDCIDECALVDYILDNMDALYCDDIGEILSDYEAGIE